MFHSLLGAKSQNSVNKPHLLRGELTWGQIGKGRNGTKCYHPGNLAQDDLTWGELENEKIVHQVIIGAMIWRGAN